MKLFVDGRKETMKRIRDYDFSTTTWLWFHCASLGEYEQAVPLIEKLKNTENKILVSFFSPSGYEQKKNHKLIDLVIYLPIDTVSNARFIVNKIKPKYAFFIKYEFWENYFAALNQIKTPIHMVSSTFRKNQVFFKWYGTFFKKTLGRVSHFFVQTETSKQVLLNNGFQNVSISGDTRYDRVTSQLQMNNTLDFVADFKSNRLCMVLGSTWNECEEVFLNTINSSNKNICFIIAPHEIKTQKIDALKSKLKVKTSIYSQGINNADQVLIVDTIGFLTRMYCYADIAYVGGGFGTSGLHNILEPAVFGTPIIIGPKIKKFPEAKAMGNDGGLRIVVTTNEFKDCVNELIDNPELRKNMGSAAANFIKKQIGATERISSFLN